MKESIHKYFKLGTLQWMSFPNSAPLDALTAIARDDFFDAVEIKSYGAEKEQAKAILEAAGLLSGFGLGVNLINGLTLGLLGVPGFGLLLMGRWLLR